MLGKANDDSVLFPKRASRLDLLNRYGLSDIAEVDSIHGSILPPCASNRTESYGSGGYETDEGGVMSRARPSEGNPEVEIIDDVNHCDGYLVFHPTGIASTLRDNDDLVQWSKVFRPSQLYSPNSFRLIDFPS